MYIICARLIIENEVSLLKKKVELGWQEKIKQYAII